MTQNTFTNHQKRLSSLRLSQANGRFFIILGALTLGLIVAIVLILDRPAAEVNQAASTPQSNALALQYAEPWLNVSESSSAVSGPSSTALEIQYAQPYLNGNAMETAVNRPRINPLEFQYAQAHLTGNIVEMAVPDAMALQYAQPWLDQLSASDPAYGTPLEMQYASP